MQVTTARKGIFSGIYYGWVVVGVVALLRFASGTETNPVLGVLQGPMTEEFGWSRGQYSAPMGVGTILGGLGGLAVGPLLDRYGGRVILSVATAVLGVAFLLMGFVQEYWQHFVLQVIGRGVLTSIFFLAVGVIIPKWFIAQRGRAAALANIGQRAGQTAFPILATALIGVSVGTFAGWRLAWIAMGVITLVAGLLPTALLMRRNPEDMGLLPDGADANPDQARLQSSTTRKKQRRPRIEVNLNGRQVLRNPAFYLLLVATSLNSFVITGVNFHWFTYFTDQGLSEGVAAASIAISPLVGIPASIIGGILVERFHVRYVYAFAFAWEAGCIVLLLFTHNAPMAIGFGLLLGVASGMSMTANAIVWADYFGRKSIGVVRGLTSPVQMALNAAGPVVAALSFDATGNYNTIFTISAVLITAGAVLTFFAAPPKEPAQPAAVPVHSSR
ncbi:MAG: MFS transporter [SAR202 cluster bacterium]|nr:MFS transporter [SAR202 cluster bacterium]